MSCRALSSNFAMIGFRSGFKWWRMSEEWSDCWRWGTICGHTVTLYRNRCSELYIAKYHMMGGMFAWIVQQSNQELLKHRRKFRAANVRRGGAAGTQ